MFQLRFVSFYNYFLDFLPVIAKRERGGRENFATDGIRSRDLWIRSPALYTPGPRRLFTVLQHNHKKYRTFVLLILMAFT